MGKKLLFIVALLLVTLSFVNADELDISYEKVSGKYELKFTEDDRVLTYDELVKKYQIGHYFSYYIDGREYYFKDGKEITLNEFTYGKEREEKRKICDNDLVYCIDINAQEDLLKKIDEVYSNRNIGKYHFFYSDSVYKNIDFKYVEKVYRDKYMTDISKNAYKYGEYGLMQPIKFLPYHDEFELIINTMTIKTTSKEEEKVDEFLDSFLKEFDGKSDFEKVLGVYSYISKTAKYESDDGYTVYTDGKISPYDVLMTHKTVCIGASTTFQFLMEKLGVESYIIDHVVEVTENSYATSHTYNIVKLDSTWYILDINSPKTGSSFLVGFSNKYDEKDFKYLGIKISNKSYTELHPDATQSFDIDYDKYVKLADSLVNESDEMTEEKKDDKKEDDKKEEKVTTINPNIDPKYVSILGILLAICVVIVYFTKKA